MIRSASAAQMIIKITRDLARDPVMLIPAFRLGQTVGQEAGLDFMPDFELTLERFKE
jgi:hypothetical protein